MSENIDKITNNLKRGELITIAGRPGMYKTSLGISIVNSISKQTNEKILYVTLESSKDTLKKRFVGNNVQIVDDINDIEDIKSKCEEMSKQGLSLVVIDYMQVITTSNEFDNKLEEKFYISKLLKTLTIELNIPVIVISQLTRSIEERENKRPTLHDTITTGLQQDSDKIICLYCDNYYNNKSSNIVELIIVKNRNERLGTVKLKFNKDTFTFE